MEINSSIIVNVDMSIAAALLSLGVFLLAIRTRSINDRRVSILRVLSGLSVINATLYLVLNFMEGPVYHSPIMLVTVLETIDEITSNMFCLYWLYYVLFSTYKSEDYLKKMQRIFNMPFYILLVLDIVNIFTGILWYYDSDVIYRETFLYTVQDVIRYGFIIVALIQYVRFRKNDGKAHFFNIWLSFVPIFGAGLLEGFSGYYCLSIGMAIGVCMLYMGISAEVGFIDKETGFYNSLYLAYIKDMIEKGRFKLAGIITYRFEDPDHMPRFSDSLIKLLPDDCETVRLDDRTIVTMSETTDGGLVFMLSEDVEAICEEMGIEVEVENEVKGKKMDSATFFTDNIDLNAYI